MCTKYCLDYTETYAEIKRETPSVEKYNLGVLLDVSSSIIRSVGQVVKSVPTLLRNANHVYTDRGSNPLRNTSKEFNRI